MQTVEDISISHATSVLPVIPAESPGPDGDAIHMRMLRRRARRISAYARFSVTALNALAGQVESDIAALRH